MQLWRCGPKVEVCQHGSHLLRPRPSSPSLQTFEGFGSGRGHCERIRSLKATDFSRLNEIFLDMIYVIRMEYMILYSTIMYVYTTHHISKCCCEWLGDCAKNTKL